MQAMQQAAAARPAAVAAEHFEADLLINDFPQAARYHVTHRDTIANISERTGVLRFPCASCMTASLALVQRKAQDLAYLLRSLCPW